MKQRMNILINLQQTTNNHNLLINLIKKSKTSASNNTSSNSNVHDINIDEKNDKNDKKRSCPDSTKKKHDYFTQKCSSSFKDQQSTPLCTIYENQQNHSFRALQSAPN
eukprot:306922_1